jgi:hypothetical protein
MSQTKISNYNHYYHRKREDGFRFIREMMEQRIKSYHAYAKKHKLTHNYVASAIMFANHCEVLPNVETITILQRKELPNYDNPIWAVTLTKEPEWMQEYELDVLALRPTTDEKAYNYMKRQVLNSLKY